MVEEQGLSAAADAIGLSKATLGFWLMRLGFEMRRVVLGLGETVTISRDGNGFRVKHRKSNDV